MKKIDIEITVGFFIFIGILCMAYTSIKLGQVEFFKNNYYELKAKFTSVTGLKKDTPVEISGVKIGNVKSIELKDYQALVTFEINDHIKIHEDAIASIRTKGILGEQYIEILPGASDTVLKPGETLFDTEPPFDLLSVIKNLVVGGDDE
ncbi:MAG: outer membrane lipid asymmetry maintenance protein MlaD [Candidatus Omnitrophica bacterium]|nr:outer membrane lipid asymmetry maintenance protein MlaD [Candidatus Omnitrophota bacterium]